MATPIQPTRERSKARKYLDYTIARVRKRLYNVSVDGEPWGTYDCPTLREFIEDGIHNCSRLEVIFTESEDFYRDVNILYVDKNR